MKSNEFYQEFNKRINDYNLEELKEVINNIIRKIPETKYNETLSIFDKDNNSINENDIKKEIGEYKKTFEQIDNFELCFHATGYEEYTDYYSPWDGDWIWEYSDEDNIGKLIYDAAMLAVELTNKKQYKYAKELFDMVLFTNYQFLDDDGGDIGELSLNDLKVNNLIDINIDVLCSYAIYVSYQQFSISNRAKNIYNYFKNENFRKISVESSFKLGSEVIKDLDLFWNDWINLLITKSGEIEYRLLKEAFIFNNFNNYEKHINHLYKCHPKIYLDIFDYLIENEKTKDMIDVGNQALSLLDTDIKIRNDIALYLAKYDDNNKERYIIESFKSDTNVSNLLRIINNGYYDKYEKEISNYIKIKNETTNFQMTELQKNIIDKNNYNYLKFFTGHFDYFYDECIKYKNPLGWSNSFIQYAVYLWLLYFNNYNNSKVYNYIIKDISYVLRINNNTVFLDDNYSIIIQKWKINYIINNNDKYIKWLKDIIDKRVTAIVDNKHRNSYFKAAILVVALGEVLESNNLEKKEDFINKYHKRYQRHSSFKKEMNKYM